MTLYHFDVTAMSRWFSTGPRWKPAARRCGRAGTNRAGRRETCIGFAMTAMAGAGSGEIIAAELGGLLGGLMMAVVGASLRQHNQTTAVRVGSAGPLSFTF